MRRAMGTRQASGSCFCFQFPFSTVQTGLQERERERRKRERDGAGKAGFCEWHPFTNIVSWSVCGPHNSHTRIFILSLLFALSLSLSLSVSFSRFPLLLSFSSSIFAHCVFGRCPFCLSQVSLISSCVHMKYPRDLCESCLFHSFP